MKRGPTKAFVSRTRVKKFLARETQFRRRAVPKHFWPRLNDAVKREARKLIGADQERLAL